MGRRHSVSAGDLDEIARRIIDGTLQLRVGCYLEVSSAAWNSSDIADRDAFAQACAAKNIRYQLVQQIGRIDWVCPDEPNTRSQPKEEP
jgi:hypothetical protein